VRIQTAARRLLIAAALAVLVLLLRSACTTTPPPVPPVVVPLASSNTPLAVAPGIGGLLVVLPDGSLWALGHPVGWTIPRASKATRIGTDSDWAVAAGGNNAGLAVRQDGSLWQMGHVLPTVTVTPMPRNGPLTRVGQATNWAAVALTDVAAAALQRDGSLWTWGDSLGMGSLGDPTVVRRAEPERTGTNTWRALAHGGSNYGFLGIDSEGRVQAWGTPHQPGPRFTAPTPFLPGTNWAEVGMHTFLERDGRLWTGPVNPLAPMSATNNIRCVGTNAIPGRYATGVGFTYVIESNGELWRRAWPVTQSVTVYYGLYEKPGRVGDRSDWVRLWSSPGAYVGLTADGTLWVWGTDWTREPRPSLLSTVTGRGTEFLNAVLRLVGWPPVGGGVTVASYGRTREPQPFLRMIPAP